MQNNEKYGKHAQFLKNKMTTLPFVSADLPGIGGEIKVVPEHFQVEEILPYAPCGEGEHVFVTLRRKLWNSADVAAELARCFELKNQDVGWGGRKDKHAVTTQTFSLQLPMAMPLADIRSRLGDLPFEIIEVQRHRNKIKTGHVAGNRFCILLTNAESTSPEHATAIADRIRHLGVPNFYGEQRFGAQGSNLDRAMQMMARQRGSRRKRDLFIISALQSALFNLWLSERMARGQYDTMIPGDMAQKTDTGGMFVVEDLKDAVARFQSGQIIYTGPMFGAKMRGAAGQAEMYEHQILEQVELTPAFFKAVKAPGTRRQAVLRINDLTLTVRDEGLQFEFTLPAGAYATVVLREFMRPPGTEF